MYVAVADRCFWQKSTDLLQWDNLKFPVELRWVDNTLIIRGFATSLARK